MRLFKTLDDFPASLRGGALTIGNFDGVHTGHARLIGKLIEQAKRLGGPSVVFTFDPHPIRLLRPEEAPPPLSWTDRKAQLLQDLGVDVMIAYPTDKQILGLSAEEFFQNILIDKLAAKGIIEGPNFFFGRGRGGNIETLGSLCKSAGISLDVVQPVLQGSDYVSSSRIRTLIEQGDVATAGTLLTQPYRIRGLVEEGSKRGRTIGFPTANLGGMETLLPSAGVYACLASTSLGIWPAAMNLGPNPTFGESSRKVEVHLIGYAGNLYGELVEVDFLAKLRDIIPFPSVGALQAQLSQDIARATEICRPYLT